jgi:hypothetical protein
MARLPMHAQMDFQLFLPGDLLAEITKEQKRKQEF